MLERRTQEAWLSSHSQPRDAYDADLEKWGESWRGGVFTLYTIAAHLHLHTESGRAAVGIMIVHVFACVCAAMCVLKQSVESNKAITPKLTHQWLTDQGGTCV